MEQIETIECLVVGGLADGVYLRAIRADADIIQLSRPTHLKPLASSKQDQPEAAKETEDYQVYTLLLDGPDDTDFVLGLAIPVDGSLAQAFGHIVTKYIQHTASELRSNNDVIQH